jgi:hypothetical protein
MIDLIQELRKLTEKWRSTGQKTRGAATEIPNLLARGHMHGMSDGLNVAADDVDSLLDQSESPTGPPKTAD